MESDTMAVGKEEGGVSDEARVERSEDKFPRKSRSC